MILMEELTDVQIGSDHTEVLRRHSIHAYRDPFCLSIMARSRTLDLQFDETKVAKEWCSKIKAIIEILMSKNER
jgi:hypothetical protein